MMYNKVYSIIYHFIIYNNNINCINIKGIIRNFTLFYL